MRARFRDLTAWAALTLALAFPVTAFGQAAPNAQGFGGVPFVTQGGHQIVGGPTGTIANCGTGATITGNDAYGNVVPGTSPLTTCALTFAAPYISRPICGVDAESTTLSYTVNPTGIVFSSPVAGVRITYQCAGQAGG